jgi:hypothetical protein
VTVVTKGDFDKLLTQVPKWMVTMMQSLVGRLRQTNEKCQELESQIAREGGGGALMLPNQKHPFQHSVRGLKILLLALAKEGVKEGTTYVLPMDAARALWIDLSGEDVELFERIVGVAEQTKFVSKKLDATKSQVLAFTNKGTFTHFVDYFSNLSKTFKPIKPYFSPDAVALFALMVEQAATSGYETLNVGYAALKAQQQSKGVDGSAWASAMAELTALPDLKMTKSTGDVTVRILVKEHKAIAGYLKFIQLFRDAKLA